MTLVDGLVLARSTFHHSINYRSVWSSAGRRRSRMPARRRPPWAGSSTTSSRAGPATPGARTPTELASTRVVWLPLDEVSAKVRTGGPIDDDEDMDLAGLGRGAAVAARGRAAEPDGGWRGRRRPAGVPLPARPLERSWFGPSVVARGYLHRAGGLGDRHAARRLDPDDRRVPDRGPGAGAGRDRQPVVGAGPAGGPGGARRGARRPGRRGRHPHPPRPRRRGRRRGPGLSRGPPSTSTRRAPATWSTPTVWSASAARVYGDLLDSLYGRLDPDAGRAHPRAGRRGDHRHRPGPHPHHRRFARARQAPSGPARQPERHPVRRRRRRGAPARRRGAAPGHPACRLRPGPGRHLAAEVPGPHARRRGAGPLRPDPRPPRHARGGRGDPAPLGRGGREGLAGRRGHRRRPRAGVLTAARRTSTPSTGPSWRPSTASIRTPPACGAGWRPPRATRAPDFWSSAHFGAR